MSSGMMYVCASMVNLFLKKFFVGKNGVFFLQKAGCFFNRESTIHANIAMARIAIFMPCMQ
jgi:hypothetical protein